MGTTVGPWLGIRGGVTAAGLAVTLGLAACGKDLPPPEEAPYQTSAGCQQDSILIVVLVDSSIGAGAYDTITAADMPLVERIANLPEYHDCQRFVVRQPVTNVAGPREFAFGPLVAIWAADSLGSQFGKPGVREPSMAQPVAVIYNFETQVAYEPLGIAPGFSCLYLWHDGGEPRHWSAAIVKLSGGPAACELPVNPGALPGSNLVVRPALLDPSLKATDIPEVTRWDWDAERKQQYIGIRCADQWCEVGSRGLVPSRSAHQAGLALPTTGGLALALPVPTNGLGNTPERLRVVDVKGWYDEQQLDTLDASGNPVLTDIVGTVFPHPALARYDSGPAPTTGLWVPAAFMKVSADYPGLVTLRAGINLLELCRGGATACGAPAGLTCSAKAQDPADLWWGRVISEKGDTSEVRCVRRRRHEGRAIPAAAARWNWNPRDATTWVACEKGCCTLN